jgi:hypothetical protein
MSSILTLLKTVHRTEGEFGSPYTVDDFGTEKRMPQTTHLATLLSILIILNGKLCHTAFPHTTNFTFAMIIMNMYECIHNRNGTIRRGHRGDNAGP